MPLAPLSPENTPSPERRQPAQAGSGEGPLVSLTRTQSIAALLEQASKDLSIDRHDGLSVAVVVNDFGTQVRGSVTYRDVTGDVSYLRSWAGEKQLDATIVWRF